MDKNDETQALVQDMKWSSVEDILEQKRVSASKSYKEMDKTGDLGVNYLQAGDPGIPYEVFVDIEAERILIESFSVDLQAYRYYSDRADYASYVKVQIDDVVREYAAVPINTGTAAYYRVKLSYEANGNENQTPLPDTYTQKSPGTKTINLSTANPIACKKFKIWIAYVRMSSKNNPNDPTVLTAKATFVKDKETEEQA